MLVFREDGISGGIFDNGVTDLFIQDIPKKRLTKQDKKVAREVINKWARKVHAHYYEEEA